MEESHFLIENKCYICELVLYKNDSVYLDNVCKIEVHKSCKEKYTGLCPICGKNVENNVGICLYTCIISTICFIFTLGFVCFVILLANHF